MTLYCIVTISKKPNLYLLFAVVFLRPLALYDEGVERDRGRVVERQRDRVIFIPMERLFAFKPAFQASSFGIRPVIQVCPGPVDDGHEVVAYRLYSCGRQVPHRLFPIGNVPDL